jgi:hypothetical protein
MNIYRYKNCVIFKLWNYHLKWAYCYPEILMHGTCIVNVITNQIRLWNNYYDNSERSRRIEVTDISENTRKHILDQLSERARQNSSHHFITGVADIEDEIYDFMKDCQDFVFIRENYIGDVTQNKITLKNQYRVWMDYQSENGNPKIVKTKPDKIDPYYMLRFKRGASG